MKTGIKLVWKCLYFTFVTVSKIGRIVFEGVKNSEAVLLMVVLLGGFVPAKYNLAPKIGGKLDTQKTSASLQMGEH